MVTKAEVIAALPRTPVSDNETPSYDASAAVKGRDAKSDFLVPYFFCLYSVPMIKQGCNVSPEPEGTLKGCFCVGRIQARQKTQKQYINLTVVAGNGGSGRISRTRRGVMTGRGPGPDS